MNRFILLAASVAFGLFGTPAQSHAAYDSECSAGLLYCECAYGEDETADSTMLPLGDDPTAAETCLETCRDYVLSYGEVNWYLYCQTTEGELDPLTAGVIDETTDVVADDTAGGEKRDPVIPNLNVAIPGLNFADSLYYDSTGNLRVNFLAAYVDALYRFLIVAMAIVAVVMMMIGGLQYILARGHADAVKKAKERMANAVIGLVLLMAAYNIAFLINPDTVKFASLKIPVVPFVPDDYADSGDTAATSLAAPGNVPATLKCDSAYTLSEMAYSTMGKVTYRMGGKLGGKAPYADDTSKVDANGVAYKTYCPDDQLCLDCSGYASMLLSCAGLPSAGNSTGDMFSGAEVIATYTDTSINGETLQPGDLIGAPGWHVVIYIGNGKIAESHGGTGRQKGNAIRVGQNLSAYIGAALTEDWGHNPLYYRRP